VSALNDAGLTGRTGHRWSIATVYYLLTNPAYKGETYAFRYMLVEPQKPKTELRRYS
jgi:hypothetical protein